MSEFSLISPNQKVRAIFADGSSKIIYANQLADHDYEEYELI
jgi:hypothetical protein